MNQQSKLIIRLAAWVAFATLCTLWTRSYFRCDNIEHVSSSSRTQDVSVLDLFLARGEITAIWRTIAFEPWRPDGLALHSASASYFPNGADAYGFTTWIRPERTVLYRLGFCYFAGIRPPNPSDNEITAA